jgi:hypothetical protein
LASLLSNRKLELLLLVLLASENTNVNVIIEVIGVSFPLPSDFSLRVFTARVTLYFLSGFRRTVAVIALLSYRTIDSKTDTHHLQTRKILFQA